MPTRKIKKVSDAVIKKIANSAHLEVVSIHSDAVVFKYDMSKSSTIKALNSEAALIEKELMRNKNFRKVETYLDPEFYHSITIRAYFEIAW